MPNHKLSETAQADVIVFTIGDSNDTDRQTQTDLNFAAFFEHFEQLAERPLSYPVTEIRDG